MIGKRKRDCFNKAIYMKMAILGILVLSDVQCIGDVFYAYEREIVYESGELGIELLPRSDSRSDFCIPFVYMGELTSAIRIEKSDGREVFAAECPFEKDCLREIACFAVDGCDVCLEGLAEDEKGDPGFPCSESDALLICKTESEIGESCILDEEFGNPENKELCTGEFLITAETIEGKRGRLRYKQKWGDGSGNGMGCSE